MKQEEINSIIHIYFAIILRSLVLDVLDDVQKFWELFNIKQCCRDFHTYSAKICFEYYILIHFRNSCKEILLSL
jgi:hypothetical protein